MTSEASAEGNNASQPPEAPRSEARSANAEGVSKETSDEINDFIFSCLLDEVFLLLDFIATRSDCPLSQLKGIPDPRNAERELSASETLNWLNDIRYPGGISRRERAFDSTLLLLVKCRLNTLARPATGLSVAYTTLFLTGSTVEHHSQKESISTDENRSKTVDLPSRTTLAARAYPALISNARRFRMNMVGLMGVSIVVTLFSVAVSYEVAFGRALMLRFDELDKQRTDLSARIYLAEQELPPNKDGAVPRLCPEDSDKNNADRNLIMNVEQQELCDSYHDWEEKDALAYRDLENYARGWLVSPFLTMNAEEKQEEPGALSASDQGQNDKTPATQTKGLPKDKGELEGAEKPLDEAAKKAADRLALAKAQSEQLAAGVLTAFSTSVLPVLYGGLGAAASVLRSVYTHVRQRTLTPRELNIAWVHLPLGLVAGVSVGLFFVTNAAPVQGAAGLAGGLTLSSSGIAFLAGYGVDAVFNLFDNLLKRVFSSAPTPAVSTAEAGKDSDAAVSIV